MSPADVSVVIPALNEAERIGAAVGSAWDNGAGQVIVCDGGSDDSTIDIAAQSGAKVVSSERGRGRQLRTGAESADRLYLLFLHADNRLEHGCLDALCRQLSSSGNGDSLWGGFRQRIESRRTIFRCLEWGNALRVRFRGMPFGDQAIFVSRVAYDRVGGIQPLPLMEDVALAKKLRRLRWPLLIPATVVVDARRWEARGVARQTLRNWVIQTLHLMGVSENRLARLYR